MLVSQKIRLNPTLPQFSNIFIGVCACEDFFAGANHFVDSAEPGILPGTGIFTVVPVEKIPVSGRDVFRLWCDLPFALGMRLVGFSKKTPPASAGIVEETMPAS